MAKWTVRAGRLLVKDGVPQFNVARTIAMPIVEADRMAHTLARLLNADADHVIIDTNAECAVMMDNAPIVCARCGASEDEGTCPIEDMATKLDRSTT